MVRAEHQRQLAEARERETMQARDRALAALRAMTDDIVEDQMARVTTLTEGNKEFLRKIIKHAEGLALRKRLAADFPTRPDFRQWLARSHNNLGVLLHATGRLKEAEAAYAEGLALRKRLAADFPTRPDFRQDLAWSYSNLGNL